MLAPQGQTKREKTKNIVCVFTKVLYVNQHNILYMYILPSLVLSCLSLVCEQVLPGRTHPLNNMSSCGGYVLTGIKATHTPDPRGVVPTARIPDMAKKHKKKRYKRN